MACKRPFEEGDGSPPNKKKKKKQQRPQRSISEIAIEAAVAASTDGASPVSPLSEGETADVIGAIVALLRAIKDAEAAGEGPPALGEAGMRLPPADALNRVCRLVATVADAMLSAAPLDLTALEASVVPRRFAAPLPDPRGRAAAKPPARGLTLLLMAAIAWPEMHLPDFVAAYDDVVAVAGPLFQLFLTNDSGRAVALSCGVSEVMPDVDVTGSNYLKPGRGELELRGPRASDDMGAAVAACLVTNDDVAWKSYPHMVPLPGGAAGGYHRKVLEQAYLVRVAADQVDNLGRRPSAVFPGFALLVYFLTGILKLSREAIKEAVDTSFAVDAAMNC